MIMDASHSRTDVLKYIKHRIDGIKTEDIDAFAMSATVSTAIQSVGGKLGRRLIANGAILMPGDVVDYVVITKPISEVRGCATLKAVEYTKSGRVKKAKATGVTDRTATVDELAGCLGAGVTEGPNVSVDFEYYKDKLLGSADRLLVF